jgi:dTDP-4-amino-4,6-dideoxygalactose transaminase
MTNVTKTYLPDRKKIDDYIDRIYASGWLTNNGELVCELEKQLCEYFGVEHLLLVSNGTLALQIAFKALDLSGEVVTTPFSFVATSSSLVWEKLTPVFADIDKNSFNLNPELIQSKITDKTSAILPVHVFGNACEVEQLEEIAKKNNVKLIFDAAHAFGVRSDIKSVLNYGDASILSFHSTKIFHTIEGGAIVFKEKAHYDKAKLLINFGISGYDKIDTVGINCKMNEFQAAMGLAVLSEMDIVFAQREVIWNRYLDFFQGTPTIILQKINSNFSKNYSYFPVVFQSEATLLKVRDELMKNDIFPRRYFYPSLNKLSYMTDYQSCPNSEYVAERILCLPIFPGLSSEIQTQLCNIVGFNI